MRYFTYWGINLTEFSLIFSIWAMQFHDNVDYMFDFKYMAIWLVSVTQAVNVVVTVVSWIALVPWYWFYGGWSTFD